MSAFTLFHVALSLVGIFTGFVVMVGLLGGQPGKNLTVVFLGTTLATTVTGFLFPFHGFTPAIGLGLISLPVLVAAFYALYGRKLAGGWRTVYVIAAVLAQYFNVFVLIVQSFQKIPALNALAPTQKEPPFAAAQGAALLLFLVWGFLAVRKFRPAAA